MQLGCYNQNTSIRSYCTTNRVVKKHFMINRNNLACMIQFTFCYMVSKCTFHEALIRSSMGSTPLTRRVDNVTNNGVTELSSSSAFVFPLVASPPVTLVS